MILDAIHSLDITVLANKVIILKEYEKIKVKQGDICYGQLHNISRIHSYVNSVTPSKG